MKIGLNTPEQLQIDKNNLTNWKEAMKINEFDERDIWQDEDKVNWVKPCMKALAVVVPLLITLVLIMMLG